MRGEPIGVSFERGFVDRGAVAVIAVPTHGRSTGRLIRCSRLGKSAQCTYTDGQHGAPKRMLSSCCIRLFSDGLLSSPVTHLVRPQRTQDLSEGGDDDPHWRPNTKDFYISQPAKSAILAGNLRPPYESSGARLPR